VAVLSDKKEDNEEQNQECKPRDPVDQPPQGKHRIQERCSKHQERIFQETGAQVPGGCDGGIEKDTEGQDETDVCDIAPVDVGKPDLVGAGVKCLRCDKEFGE